MVSNALRTRSVSRHPTPTATSDKHLDFHLRVGRLHGRLLHRFVQRRQLPTVLVEHCLELARARGHHRVQRLLQLRHLLSVPLRQRLPATYGVLERDLVSLKTLT